MAKFNLCQESDSYKIHHTHQLYSEFINAQITKPLPGLKKTFTAGFPAIHTPLTYSNGLVTPKLE
jgi:hypothetical protein